MSSLKDLASLIMVPSLYKDGELHTVKPLGNSILHPDATGNHDGTDGSTPAEGNFTFSRGSNLAATRVDVNGLIEKGRENLLTYSNDFSNGVWAKSNLSVASSNNAWEVTDNTTSGSHYIYWGGTTPASTILTLSVEAKAGSVDYLAMRLGGFTYAFFDVANGTLGAANPAFIDTKIEATSNGFYKCSATILTPSSGSASVFYPTDNNGIVSYTGTGALAITIKNAQLEQGLVATDYIETGASTAQAGILEDMPRLDYSGSCPALLLEPQRTNQCSHSEYIGSSDWAGGGVTRDVIITQTSEINPEGGAICWKMQGTSANNQLANNSTTTSGTTITNSIYVKRVSGTGNVLLRDVNNTDTSFSLSVADGWKRIDVTATATSVTARFYLNLVDYTDEILVWGAQQEVGSYPTSYIPTYGSSVTRSWDDNTASFADIESEGTMFGEVEVIDTGAFGTPMALSINDATTNFVLVYKSNINKLSARIRFGGVDQCLIDSGTLTEGYHKFAFRYRENDCEFFVDGVSVGTDTIVSIPTGLNTIRQYIGSSTNPFVGGTKQLAYFPTALTDSECIALTTL